MYLSGQHQCHTNTFPYLLESGKAKNLNIEVYFSSIQNSVSTKPSRKLIKYKLFAFLRCSQIRQIFHKSEIAKISTSLIVYWSEVENFDLTQPKTNACSYRQRCIWSLFFNEIQWNGKFFFRVWLFFNGFTTIWGH